MSKLVIISTPKDAHAHAIAWAVRQFGVEVRIMSVADLPDYAQLSWKNGCVQWTDRNGAFEIEPDDLLFARRKWEICAPEDCHEDDAAFVEAQCNTTLNWVLDYLGDTHENWVQRPSDIRRANNKLIQLRVAESCGFAVPETIVSNHFRDVDRFVKTNGARIAKTIVPKNWSEGDDNYFTFTSEITASELDQASTELCPMIYQDKVAKLYEWRAIVIGGSVSAIRQDPNLLIDTAVDSRRAVGFPLKPKLLALPERVETQLKKICERHSLKVGAFDLIETALGDFVFLEVNESGQFLWLEEFEPEIKLLEKMTLFLLSLIKNSSSARQKSSTDITFQTFLESYPADLFRLAGAGVGQHKQSQYASV